MTTLLSQTPHTTARLTDTQQAEFDSMGQMVLSVARSRAEAIRMVSGMDPTKVDPDVRRALLDNLVESLDFLHLMGVDRNESIPSVVRAMRKVSKSYIGRFIHYADQFRHDLFPKSVLSAMDQAVARGDVRRGTKQAWIDAIGAKLRVAFPGIPESQWAINKQKKK